MSTHLSLTPEQSPALKTQGISYPWAWDGRIPRRVQIVKTVRIPLSYKPLIKQPIALAGTQFDVWVSWTGLVIILFESGEALCVRFCDFVVVAWHEKELGQ